MRQALPVGEDAYMFAQSSLLVEHIAAHRRLVCEQRIERRADGFAVRLARALTDDAAQPGREVDLGHRHQPIRVAALRLILFQVPDIGNVVNLYLLDSQNSY